MNKKIVLIIILVVVFTALAAYAFGPKIPKNSLSTPLTTQLAKKVLPSNTFIQYTDPSGFSFNYPDNLSISKNDISDNNTYADLQLSSKEVNGSLSLKITDSKFNTLDEWLKANKLTQTSKEVKLGSLKALEVTTDDRLFLAALDKGILFNIEVPLVEQAFWTKVYNKILADFSFTSPENTTQADTSSNDVTFEGEEIVE